jgi:hypothetical protein
VRVAVEDTDHYGRTADVSGPAPSASMPSWCAAAPPEPTVNLCGIRLARGRRGPLGEFTRPLGLAGQRAGAALGLAAEWRPGHRTATGVREGRGCGAVRQCRRPELRQQAVLHADEQLRRGAVLLPAVRAQPAGWLATVIGMPLRAALPLEVVMDLRPVERPA